MNNITTKAVIFDMDGVLIDSEPLWQLAEFEVFSPLIDVTIEQMQLTTGLRVDQLVDYWFQRQPWPNYNQQDTADAIVTAVVTAIIQQGQAMHGTLTILKQCQQQGLKIGLATSSPLKIVNAVLDKLAIRDYFDAICSAEHLHYGKPHPEVYLNCAQQLAVPVNQCIAIEDSFNGTIAAKAANIRTIVIPETHCREQLRWHVADWRCDDLLHALDIIKKTSA